MSKSDEAFDNLTDEIMKLAGEMEIIHECSCCDKKTDRFMKLYLCDTHMNKYKDILSIEKK